MKNAFRWLVVFVWVPVKVRTLYRLNALFSPQWNREWLARESEWLESELRANPGPGG